MSYKVSLTRNMINHIVDDKAKAVDFFAPISKKIKSVGKDFVN